MSAITPEIYTSMGINDSEYALILQLLGREPSYTELGMFAVMWSEHCGYKFSRPVLAYFKKYKEALEGKGFENAGIVDIGGGWGVTMKVESHNHPSAVEPYQGAATGVGGIIRDILTMGARPIASLNSLRFGPITDGSAPEAEVKRNRFLFEHVVSGIAGYGNCVGVPTVAGEVNFHRRYSGNPLVNAMCVGVLKMEDITTAAAAGPGNPVIYLGSATGRDGIHGATFASEALDDESEAKRPNVQIGDPFAEKQVIEATLEALKTGAIVAIQDMGAAGLTCSTVEMASKGEVGMDVNLDLVPMRESDMSGYELMLSESQERMLCVAHKGREQEVLDVFRKWGTHAVVIGTVTEEKVVRIKRHGETIAELDPRLLTDHCPTYETPQRIPETFRQAEAFDPATAEQIDSHAALLNLLGASDIASKRFVYQQYDQQVQTQTVALPGPSDAAVLQPSDAPKAIALKIDGNGRQTLLHPRRGGELAVAEACRNVACTGAKPVAVTDGLNFGNPTRPEVYWQFSEAVQGIAHAAEILETPVISGNVSFYNESDLGEVPPTPLIGVLGLLESVDHRIPAAPAEPVQLGLVSIDLPADPHAGLGASQFLAELCNLEIGYPVATDLEAEKRLHGFLYQSGQQKLLCSAHDTSEGGLGVALAEVCIFSGFGASVTLSDGPANSVLYGEYPGRVLVSYRDAATVRSRAEEHGLSFVELGSLNRSDELGVQIGSDRWTWLVAELEHRYESSIPAAMSS